MELNFADLEKKILKFWQEKRIFAKIKEKNQGKKRWSFLDGPITANNPMGVHHAWGRTYKDLFQRYKTRQGFDQRFQSGFDCQGLWVEVEVEKELGFKTKKDIERYGLAEFVEKCKERVRKYAAVQTAQSIRLGQWMDWRNSYYTMSDENNYAIWHFLKKCQEKGLLYKGRDVVPWCIRCGTAISQHEILTEEYKEISHQSIFFKLPVIGRSKTFFLVWTTTPWTLPANVAVAVNPELIYAEVRNEKGETFILLENKAGLVPGGKIIKTVKGEQLKNSKYLGLFDELPAVKEVLANWRHSAVLWDEVSQEEGTGVVHLAPGCGQEDFKLSKELNLPVINPVNDEGKYEKGFGLFSGKSVVGINGLIFENLKEKDSIFKIEDYLHRYPTCWRCKSELIFRLVDEWYISMEKLKKPLATAAKKIKWIPSFGLERELDWLKNMQDWLISKKRYWGLALPIYQCFCGNFEVIGSKEELEKRAVEGWPAFNGHSPHRPWVDEVKIKCLKCGRKVSRITDVGNPWLDAGIVPFSTLSDDNRAQQLPYFHDKKEEWRKWFPLDFICESFPGQFKNWFYSLLVMSVVLENTNPVKTIFGYASVRDEKGEEMHKSKGNAIWFDEAVEKLGADPMRWLYFRQNPAYNLNFGYKAVEEVGRKLLTFWNTFVFFRTYTTENEMPKKSTLPKSRYLLDRWIVSRLNNLIAKVTRNLDGYQTAAAAAAIEKFFIDDLSLWYVRRSRQRFQKPKNKKDKKEAGETLYWVILNLAGLMAPVVPFLAEEIYRSLKLKDMSDSVHLTDWPQSDKKLINSELEKKMVEVRKIVTLALAERAKAGIKVRQPLACLQLANRKLAKDKELLELIKGEVNVKKISFGRTLKLNAKITPQLKEEGIIREITRQIQEMRKKAGLKPQDKISASCQGDEYLIGILSKNKNSISEEAKIKNLVFKGKTEKFSGEEKKVEIDRRELRLTVKKL